MIIVSILALENGTKDVKRMHKLLFVTALISIIPWYLIQDPLFSVIIVTLVDAFAFVPTIRKTFNDPHSETLTSFLSNLKT